MVASPSASTDRDTLIACIGSKKMHARNEAPLAARRYILTKKLPDGPTTYVVFFLGIAGIGLSILAALALVLGARLGSIVSHNVLLQSKRYPTYSEGCH